MEYDTLGLNLVLGIIIISPLSLNFCPMKWGGTMPPGQLGVRIGDDRGKAQAQSGACSRCFNERGSGYSPGGWVGREGATFTAAQSLALTTYPTYPG